MPHGLRNMSFFIFAIFSPFSPKHLQLFSLFFSRVIQSSHPVCNTIMLFGIIVCFTSVFLLGLDGRFVFPETFPAVCQSRVWLLAVGFTLSFGAMFSKVWRVHRLSTKAKTDPKVKMVSYIVKPGNLNWNLKFYYII